MKRPRRPAEPLHACACATEVQPDDLFAKACAITAMTLYCQGCLTSPSLIARVQAMMTPKLARRIIYAVGEAVRKEAKG